jgi:hypothetical protein
VPAAHQPQDHIRAHTAEADHPELHYFSLFVR